MTAIRNNHRQLSKDEEELVQFLNTVFSQPPQTRAQAQASTRDQIVVGINGIAGSGKDTAADFLVKHHGFKKIGLADPMKEICKSVFGFTDLQLWGPSEERERPDPRWDGLTPRHALQQLGTEWGRAMHQDVWVRFAMERAARAFAKGYAGVVISDIRFDNEARVITNRGGEIWHIVRPGARTTGSIHTSENGIDFKKVPSANFLRIINDATLAELQESVARAVAGIPARATDRSNQPPPVPDDFSGYQREQLEEILQRVQTAIALLGPQ